MFLLTPSCTPRWFRLQVDSARNVHYARYSRLRWILPVTSRTVWVVFLVSTVVELPNVRRQSLRDKTGFVRLALLVTMFHSREELFCIEPRVGLQE